MCATLVCVCATLVCVCYTCVCVLHLCVCDTLVCVRMLVYVCASVCVLVSDVAVGYFKSNDGLPVLKT